MFDLSRVLIALSLLLLVAACGGSSSRSGADQSGADQSGVDQSGVDASDGTSPSVSRFVVAVGNEGLLSVLRVNGANGSLWHRTFLPTGGFALRGVLRSPDGRFVYAIADNGKLHTFSLDASDGTPTALTPLDLGGSPSGLVLDSNGTSLYVALGSGGVQHLTLDPSTGVAKKEGAAQTGVNATRVVLHPSGSLLFALDRTNSKVVAFKRTVPGGSLSPAESSTIDAQATGLALDSRGRVAYVTYSQGSDNVKVYDVDATTGALTARQTLTANSNPSAILVDSAGKVAYVANSGSNNVTRFLIDAESGELTKRDNVNGGEGPVSLALSPAGDYLYSANFDGGGVSVFSIAPADGALTFVDTSYVAQPVSAVVSVPGSGYLTKKASFAVAPDSLGVQLYRVTDEQGTLSLSSTAGTPGSAIRSVVDQRDGVVYTIRDSDNKIVSFPFNRPPDGTTPRTEMDGPTDVPRLAALLVGPLSRYLYVLDARNQSDLPGSILRFSIGPEGLIAPQGSTSTGNNPEELVLHPAGRWMYALNSFADTISYYTLDLESGLPSLRGTITPGKVGQGAGRPLSMDFHPNGRYAYLTLSHDSELVRFHVAPTNGELETPQRTSTTGISAVDDRPLSIAVDDQGRFLVVSFIGEEVASYRIDPETFSLSHVDTLLLDGLAPRYLAIDPQSRFVYVTIKGGTARLLLGSDGKLSGPVQTETPNTDSATYRAVTIVSDWN